MKKKVKLIIWAIVVTVIIVGVGIYDKLFSLDMMRVKETFMLGDIYGWIRYDCSTNEVGLIMCGDSPLNIYFTNQVFTFDGTNIVAQFAYSGIERGHQLFASTNMLFWANRSGKIVRGPNKIRAGSIYTIREKLNMEKFIKGWIWVSHRGTEKRQDEYMQTNSSAIFLTNQVFSFGGSNITARFASPRKVDDKQLVANTNMIFWVDPSGKIEGEPYEVRAPIEFDR